MRAVVWYIKTCHRSHLPIYQMISVVYKPVRFGLIRHYSCTRVMFSHTTRKPIRNIAILLGFRFAGIKGSSRPKTVRLVAAVGVGVLLFQVSKEAHVLNSKTTKSVAKQMIKLATKLPNKLYIACSGGVDSMVLLDFSLRGKREIILLHVNHNTEHGKEAQEFVSAQAKKYGLELLLKKISNKKSSNSSPEEFWRNERRSFFTAQDGIVATAHHLDDAVEWWVFSSLRGHPNLIPIKSDNIIKPLLLTGKKEILDWAKRKNVSYINDPSNADVKYARNLIRKNIIPEALKVNPGLRTVVKKKYMDVGKRLRRGLGRDRKESEAFPADP